MSKKKGLFEDPFGVEAKLEVAIHLLEERLEPVRLEIVAAAELAKAMAEQSLAEQKKQTTILQEILDLIKPLPFTLAPLPNTSGATTTTTVIPASNGAFLQ